MFDGRSHSFGQIALRHMLAQPGPLPCYAQVMMLMVPSHTQKHVELGLRA